MRSPGGDVSRGKLPSERGHAGLDFGLRAQEMRGEGGLAFQIRGGASSFHQWEAGGPGLKLPEKGGEDGGADR